MELLHAIDKHTKGLIATNIELLLDYCMRFTSASSSRART